MTCQDIKRMVPYRDEVYPVRIPSLRDVLDSAFNDLGEEDRSEIFNLRKYIEVLREKQ